MFQSCFVYALAAALAQQPSAASAPQTPQTPPAVSTTVVVTATVSPTPESAAGRAVTVLPRVDLDTLGVTSSIDALRLAPGVDLRARGPFEVQTDLSIRGATFGQQLVLVDGVRLNDAQSGHHNGEFPMPLAALDRIELVGGAASSVHGADALGGVVNLITRRDQHLAISATAGEHGSGALSASIGGYGLPARWTLAGWTSRSDGFMFDRDFALGGALLRGAFGRDLTFDVRHQRRTFGANGFYGASPSKEWTDLTLTSATWSRAVSGWTTTVRGTWKNHGDHFRWDIARPGFAENRHRTNAGDVLATVSRTSDDGITISAGAGGAMDVVRSSNLGDHDFSHGSAFVEVLAPLSSSLLVQAGVRGDRYSSFGGEVSPTFSAVAILGDGWRLRGSVGRAFRVPTFTELYYLDPNNVGNADLRAERGWSTDAGLEFARSGWSAAVTPFLRWDRDVIDFTRPTASVPWHADNVRDVTTRGVEVRAARHWRDGLASLSYTGLDLSAPSLNVLSKYVLEYAKHALVGSVATPLGIAGLRASVTADYRRRLDGQRYTLVGAQLSHDWGRATLSIGGTNLLNETYTEVAGVAMPGRWLTVGMAIR